MTKIVDTQNTRSQLSLADFIEVHIIDNDGLYPRGYVKIDGHELPATQMIERSDVERMIGIEPGVVMMFMLEGSKNDYRIILFEDKVHVEAFDNHCPSKLCIHRYEGHEWLVESFVKYCRENVIPDCLAAKEDNSRAIES